MIQFKYKYEAADSPAIITYEVEDSDELTWMEILTHATWWCESIGYTISHEKLKKWAKEQDELRRP